MYVVSRNGVIKKTVYDILATKVSAMETKLPSTSGLVAKTQYVSDKKNLEKKIMTRRCITLIAWSIRINTTQKFQRLKTRHLVLLV